jgi:predicted transcriptional regulator
MAEATAKQRALQALRTLPDDASLEDAIEQLCFIAKVEEGLRQSEAGELTPHEDVKKQFLS